MLNISIIVFIASTQTLLVIMIFIYIHIVAYNTTMKKTFDLNFDLYQALKQHGYTKHGNQECNFVIRKKAC